MDKLRVIFRKPCKIGENWFKIGDKVELDFETVQQGVLNNCFEIEKKEVIESINKIPDISEKVVENTTLSDEEIVENLCKIDYIDIDIAQKLLILGIKSAEDIVKKSLVLKNFKNYKKIIESAKEWME